MATSIQNGFVEGLELSEDQEQAVQQFLLDTSKLASGKLSAEDENANSARLTAIRFLHARKWDVSRALDLYKNYEKFRRTECLEQIDPSHEGVRRELLSEKFTILQTRDDCGAAIAVFTARRHWPPVTTHRDTLKALILQLDAATSSFETQKHGLVFIYDMTESKYSNFDYDLSTKILNMLKGTYPARLRLVLIVTAPLWFKAPFQVLRLFVREKLRDRVTTVEKSKLCNHVPAKALPRHLGGHHDEYDHRAWLRKAFQVLNLESKLQEDWYQPSACMSMSTSLPPDSDTSSVSSMNDLPTPNSDSCPGSKRPKVDDGLSDDDLLAAKVASVHRADDPEQNMTMDQFVSHVGRHEREGLVAEYLRYFSVRAPEPHEDQCAAFKSVDNKSKNRYADVPCLDSTRVRLKPVDGGGDYIHANWVDSYRQRRAFICTQGPLMNTAADFWATVWQRGVFIVVMTTRQVEGRRVKCFQYWPLEEGSSDIHGNYKLYNDGVHRTENLSTTQLILQDTNSGEQREVTHFQFTSWPDYGVPPTAGGFLDCLETVRHAYRARLVQMGWPSSASVPEYQLSADKRLPSPIVVHCSAGIGRTGTFISMDILMKRLADTGRICVRDTVQKLRAQRAGSIQMPEQYVFVHLALLEHASREGLLNTEEPVDSEEEVPVGKLVNLNSDSSDDDV